MKIIRYMITFNLGYMELMSLQNWHLHVMPINGIVIWKNVDGILNFIMALVFSIFTEVNVEFDSESPMI